MDNNKLKLFKNEGEVLSYAKINGYDEGNAKSLVQKWSELQKSKSVTKNSKKITMMEEDKIEIKTQL